MGISSCTKEVLRPVDHNILGKWIYKESGTSIGGPIIWQSAAPANQTIEFKQNGAFISAQGFLNGTNHYEKLDSVTLKFSPVANASGFIKMAYVIDSSSGQLNLWPVDPICIEGCGYRFVRGTN